MKKIIILIALLTSFVSYAQTDEILKVNYYMTASYLKDPYSESTLYLNTSGYEEGIILADLNNKTDSLNRPVVATFVFIKTNKERDTKLTCEVAEIRNENIGRERERDYHIDYYARDYSWKIKVFTNTGIIELFYSLIPEEKEYENLKVYYLK